MRVKLLLMTMALSAVLITPAAGQPIAPQVGIPCNNLGLSNDVPVFVHIGTKIYGCPGTTWQVIADAAPAPGPVKMVANTPLPQPATAGSDFDGWNHYAVLFQANGAGSCVHVGGCWTVNGGAPVNAAGALTQSLVLFQLPAKGFVTAYRKKTSTLCAGGSIATYTLSLGDANSATFYASTLYDLTAAVSATNIEDGPTTAEGASTSAAINVVAGLTTTVANITATTACAFDVWIKWGVLP